MSDVRELLDEMFPGSINGWPPFSEACSDFLNRREEEISSSIQEEVHQLQDSAIRSVDLENRLMRLRRNPKWRAFEEEAVKAYFSSSYFTINFRTSGR